MKPALFTAQLFMLSFVLLMQIARAQSIEVKLPQNADGSYQLNYGKLMEGLEGDEMASMQVTLSNPGSQPIELISIDSDCACLSANMPESTSIPAGSTASITVYYNNRRLGPFSKQLRLVTDADAITIQASGSVQLRVE